MKLKTPLSLSLFFSLLPLFLSNALQAQPAYEKSQAPVPDMVAISRPSAADIEKAKNSLETFLSKLDADTRRIFESYPDLLSVRPPGINTAIVPNLSPRFVTKHNENKTVAKAGDVDVLFMGDSITDWWRSSRENYAGKTVFDHYFGNMKVANFGIAGDTTQGVLFRLQNGEGEGFTPKAIMLMIGTNNTRANTAPEIAEGVGAVVLEMQSRFPDAKILLLGIFPRSRPNDPVRGKISKINTIISRLDNGESVVYLDIRSIFLDENGLIPADVMSDGLHPTKKGYQLWAEAVKGPLSELL